MPAHLPSPQYLGVYRQPPWRIHYHTHILDRQLSREHTAPFFLWIPSGALCQRTDGWMGPVVAVTSETHQPVTQRSPARHIRARLSTCKTLQFPTEFSRLFRLSLFLIFQPPHTHTNTHTLIVTWEHIPPQEETSIYPRHTPKGTNTHTHRHVCVLQVENKKGN